MAKRLICLCVLTAMVVCMLCACGKNGPVTVEEAKKIVLKDLGTKESKLSAMDIHVTTVDGVAMTCIVRVK